MRTCAGYVVFAVLLVQHMSGAPLTAANQAWNTRSNWTGHVYRPSKSDWRSTVCFQLMTDRFFDGCPTNNELAYGGYDVKDRSLRHGGDFEGVRRKTDYLKGLGVDMIWISPVFQNKWNDYHGYGQIDRTLFDQRWGTVTDFRNMADALHQNDLYLCIDEVSNHGGNLLYGSGGLYDWPTFHMHADEHTLHYYTNSETHLDYTVNNTYSSIGNYGSNYDTSGNPVSDSGTGGFFADDFHHNGNCSFDSSWQQWLGEFPGVGYDDFATERASCIASHLDGFKALMRQDIDAIREDTPMEMLVYYFQQWCPASRVYGRDYVAKSNFFMFGEYFTSFDYAKKMTGKNANGTDFCLNSGVDYRAYFDFFRPAVADQNNGNLSKLKNTYDAYKASYDFNDWADNLTKYTMLTFYNNHDQPRLSTWTDGDAKTRLASGIVLTWPGIPCLYHGDEQGFKTAFDGDKNVREDYMVSAAYVTDGGVTNRARVNNFNMCHENYQWIAKIANYRRLYPALWQTDELYERWHQNNNDNGVYAFTRVWGTATNWVLAVFNTWSGSQTYGPMATGWADGTVVVNVMNTSETATITGGNMSGSCIGYGLQIWVDQTNLRTLDPVVESMTPAHDAWPAAPVTNIILTFSKPMAWGALTNAFRINNQPVNPAHLSLYNGNTTLAYASPTPLADGINYISVLTNAYDTANNQHLFANYAARIRIGSTTNPVVNYDLASDATLINDGGGYNNVHVTLTHKATGAAWFRCSNDGTTWGAWTTYTNVSTWTLAGVGGTRRVWVQYWADGSAAAIIYADANESTSLQANFIATPQLGAEPLTVYFTNTASTSTAAIVSYRWDFGDSTTASDAHPVHTYAGNGDYTVRLVVYDGFATATNTKQRYISVAYRATNAWDDMESSAAYAGGIIGNNGGSGFGVWQAGNLTDGGTWWSGTEIAGSHCLGVWANAADVSKQYSLRRSLALALTNESTVSVTVRGSANLWSWTEARIAFVLRNGNSADHSAGQRLALFFACSDSANTNLYWYDGSDHKASVTYTQNHIYHFVIALNPASNTYTFTVTDDNDSNNKDTRSGTLTGTAGAPIDSFAIYEKLGTSQHDVHWDTFCAVGYSNPLQAAFSATPTNGPAPLAVHFSDASPGNPTAWSWDFDNNGSIETSDQNPDYLFPTAGTYAVKLVISNGASVATTIKTSYIIVGAPITPGAPDALTCTAFAHRVDLAWNKNASNDAVVLVRNASGTFGAPANGTWYSAGQTCAGGSVIYQGAATWASDTNRPPASAHYYKTWSVNAATNYSLTGATANTTTLPFDAPSALTVVAHVDALDLAWMTNNAGTGVMLVRNTSGSFYDPVDGTTYADGSSALGGTIVYHGKNMSLTDAGLGYNTLYHYKLWSLDDQGGGNYPYYSAAAASASKSTGDGLPSFTNLTFTAAADAALYATALSGGVWYVASDAYWWTNGAAPAAGARVLTDGVRNPEYGAVEVALEVQAWAAQPYQRAGIIACYHLGAGGTQEYYTLTITNASTMQLVMARWQGATESVLATNNAGMAFDAMAVYRLVLTLNNGTYRGIVLTGDVEICRVNGSDSTIAAGKVGVYAGYGSGAHFGGFSTQIPEPALLVWSVLMAGMAAMRRAGRR